MPRDREVVAARPVAFHASREYRSVANAVRGGPWEIETIDTNAEIARHIDSAFARGDIAAASAG